MFVVKENEQIRLCVISGQRPDLSVITGPDPLMSLTINLMTRCWHQRPDKRPEFAGIYYVNYRFSRSLILNFLYTKLCQYSVVLVQLMASQLSVCDKI